MVASLAALYLHYGPFARQMDQRLCEQIRNLATARPPVAHPQLTRPFPPRPDWGLRLGRTPS